MYRAASADFAWQTLSPLEFSSTGPPPHLGALLAGSLLRHAEVSLQWTPALATAVPMLGGFPSLPFEPRFAPPSAAELGPIFAVRRLVRFDARGRMGILPDIWTQLLSNPSLQGLRALLVGRTAEYVPLVLLGVRQVQEQKQELKQEQDEQQQQQQQLPQESFLPALTHLHVSTRNVLFLPLVRAALAGVDSMVRLRHLSLFESSWAPVGAPDQGPRLALRQAVALAASNGHVTRLALGHIRLPLVADLLWDTPLAHSLRVLTLCLDVVEGLSGEHDASSGVSADKAASALPPFDWAGIWASMPLLEQLSLHIFHGADALLLGLAEEVAARAPSLRRLRVRPLHLARPDIDAATAAGADENALPPSLVSPLPSLSIMRRLLFARPHLHYTLQLLPRADYLQSHAAHEPHAAEDWERVHTHWHGELVRQFGEHRVYLQFRPHGAPPEEKEN
jgi:hypothetical protein